MTPVVSEKAESGWVRTKVSLFGLRTGTVVSSLFTPSFAPKSWSSRRRAGSNGSGGDSDGPGSSGRIWEPGLSGGSSLVMCFPFSVGIVSEYLIHGFEFLRPHVVDMVVVGPDNDAGHRRRCTPGNDSG